MILYGRVTVTAAATLIYGPAVAPTRVWFRNTDAANAIDLGGLAVTSGGGLQLPFGAAIEMTCEEGDAIYGIAAASKTASVGYLTST